MDLGNDEALRAFVDDVRSAYAFGPPPRIGPRLSAVLTRGLGPEGEAERPLAAPTAHPARRTWRLAGRLQGRRARLGLGAAVASLTFLGTGAAGALPGPAQSAFERTAAVVGIELPEPTRPVAPSAPTDQGPGTEPAGRTDSGDGPGSPPAGPRPSAPEPGSPPVSFGGGADDGPPAAPQPSRPGDAGPPGDTGEGAGGQPGQGPPDGVPAPSAPGPPDRSGTGPPPGAPGPPGGSSEGPGDDAGRHAGEGAAPARSNAEADGPPAIAWPRAAVPQEAGSAGEPPGPTGPFGSR